MNFSEHYYSFNFKVAQFKRNVHLGDYRIELKGESLKNTLKS